MSVISVANYFAQRDGEHFRHFSALGGLLRRKTVKMAAEQNTKKFKCEICDYSTPHGFNLNKHTNLVHLKIKNFECTQCSKKFGSNSILKKHMISCTQWGK
jgi:uncharacterized Zn-finger protein